MDIIYDAVIKAMDDCHAKQMERMASRKAKDLATIAERDAKSAAIMNDIKKTCSTGVGYE